MKCIALFGENAYVGSQARGSGTNWDTVLA